MKNDVSWDMATILLSFDHFSFSPTAKQAIAIMYVKLCLYDWYIIYIIHIIERYGIVERLD